MVNPALNHWRTLCQHSTRKSSMLSLLWCCLGARGAAFRGARRSDYWRKMFL